MGERAEHVGSSQGSCRDTGKRPGAGPLSEASEAPDLIQSTGSPPPPGSPLRAHHCQEGVEEGGAACRVNFNLLD